MGGLLGPVGGLEELECASELQVSPVAPEVVRVTRALDGTEYAQVAPCRPNRTWDVQVGTAQPEGMNMPAQLAEYTRAMFRTLVWYSEDAQVENLLDPDASLMDPARWSPNLLPNMGARVQPWGDDGPRFYRSGATPDPARGGTTASRTVWLSRIPVPRSRDVAVSVFLTAYAGYSALLTVNELDMEGKTVATTSTSTAGTLQRVTRLFKTKPNTVAISIAIRDALTIVAPAVTLTKTVQPWVDGQGCMNAVLEARPSKQVQHAWDDAHGRRSAYSWTIRELGKAGMSHGW